MKRFVLVHIGYEQPTAAVMRAWEDWFESIDEVIVENIGLGPAVEVTTKGARELPFDRAAVTGYSIIEVESREEAIEIAQCCPFVSGVGVYEVRSQQV